MPIGKTGPLVGVAETLEVRSDRRSGTRLLTIRLKENKYAREDSNL